MKTYEEVRKSESIRFANSFNRMERVLESRYELNREDWLRLLGKEWPCSDRIRHYRLELRKILGTSGPIREMMTAEENIAYDRIPESGSGNCERVSIYAPLHGFYPGPSNCNSEKEKDSCPQTRPE